MQLIASLSDAHGPSVTLSSLASHMNTLYSGALDGSLCVWHPLAESNTSDSANTNANTNTNANANANANSMVHSFTLVSKMENVHPLGIVSLFAGPKGAYLASHSIEASQLLLHRMASDQRIGSGREGEEIEKTTVPISPIHAYCLALCKETDEIWMGGLGPILEIMKHPIAPQSSSHKTTLELPAHPIAPLIQHITCLAVTSSLVALSTESHTILLYDRKKAKWLPVALHEHTKPIRSLTFQACPEKGCYLWSSGDDGRVHLYEILPVSHGETAWQAKYRLGWNAHTDWITRMLLLVEVEGKEAGHLVTASSSGQLKLWQLPFPLGSVVMPNELATCHDVPGEGPIWALCKGPGSRSVCVARGTCLSLYQQPSST